MRQHMTIRQRAELKCRAMGYKRLTPVQFTEHEEAMMEVMQEECDRLASRIQAAEAEIARLKSRAGVGQAE